MQIKQFQATIQQTLKGVIYMVQYLTSGCYKLSYEIKKRPVFTDKVTNKGRTRIMTDFFLVNTFLKKKEKNFKKVLIICEKRVIL